MSSLFTFSSGTITGAGSLVLSGATTWNNSGVISLTGITTVPHGAILNVGTATYYPYLEGPMTNDGTINVNKYSASTFITPRLTPRARRSSPTTPTGWSIW